jgi:hypothetical protein
MIGSVNLRQQQNRSKSQYEIPVKINFFEIDNVECYKSVNISI